LQDRLFCFTTILLMLVNTRHKDDVFTGQIYRRLT